MDSDAKVIFIISIFVYIMGIGMCSWYLSDKNKKNKYNDKCCKFIKKYNFFGDRVQEEPTIDYVEV